MRRGIGFSAFLLLVSGGLLATALGLSPPARLAPFWVLLFTFVLAFVQLTRDVRRGPADGAVTGGVLGVGDRSGSRGRRGTGRRDEVHTRELRGLVWVLGLVTLVHLIGVFPAVPVFLAPYLRLEAGMRWRASLASVAVVTAGLFLVFGMLVDVPFPEALLL